MKSELTWEELSEVYLMLSNGLVPYVKANDVTQYQLFKLVEATKKLGNLLYGKKENEDE